MRLITSAGCLLIFCAAGCEGWSVQLADSATAEPPPSRTAVISTPTPFVATLRGPSGATASSWPTASPTETNPTPSHPRATSPTSLPDTDTATAPESRIEASILGCDGNADLAGETGSDTSAYVLVMNAGSSDATNVCATLNGLDEQRPLADKTRCLADLPAGYEVTFRLTIGMTYRPATPVQVEIKSSDSLLLRLGDAACPNPILEPDQVGSLGTPKPAP